MSSTVAAALAPLSLLRKFTLRLGLIAVILSLATLFSGDTNADPAADDQVPDIDLETLVLGLLVIGGQTIAFAVRPATPMVRILAAGAGVIVFLVMPIGWAIAAGMALIAVVLLLDPKVPDRDAMANLLLLGGFLAMIPVVYAILWISQHSVGREATLPALFGSAFVVFALFLGSRARLLSSALLGASGGLLVAGILAAIFWRPVD